jgi:propionyl-CoA/long-chain acyl-CoA carboxylase carboxyl transferase subunit
VDGVSATTSMLVHSEPGLISDRRSEAGLSGGRSRSSYAEGMHRHATLPSVTDTDIHTTAGRLADLAERLEAAVHAGSERAIDKQHAKGKLTARERVALLLDDGSFVELDELARHRATNFGMESNRPYGDGVVTGYGTVDGRPVCVFAQDFTVFGGSLGQVFGEKIVKVMDLAMKTGCPVIGINDSGGARIQEGVVSLGLYGEIFRRNVHASGVIPQISLVMGPCAGGAVYSPAVTDFTVMVDKTSHMFITGPDVIKTVTGEDVTMEDLGGAHTHNSKSGNAHYLGADEDDAIDFVKALLSYLPQNNLEDPPAYSDPVDLEVTDDDRALDLLVPDSPNQPYDMHVVVETVLDGGEFLEVQALFAPNILVGFGRVEGQSVGVVANQPMQYAGTLDIDASEKGARFVRTCDAFNIPVLTFVDVPGFLPGTSQEWSGIIRRGAKLLFAYAEATVPLITVITRKAYGGAYDVMGSKHLGADINVAWPTAQIAVMGAQGAVNILYRSELGAADDVDAARAQLITDYEDTLANPYVAAERGYVDAVIAPHETRSEIVRSLRLLRNKRETLPPKKHGNIPL